MVGFFFLFLFLKLIVSESARGGGRVAPWWNESLVSLSPCFLRIFSRQQKSPARVSTNGTFGRRARSPIDIVFVRAKMQMQI